RPPEPPGCPDIRRARKFPRSPPHRRGWRASPAPCRRYAWPGRASRFFPPRYSLGQSLFMDIGQLVTAGNRQIEKLVEQLTVEGDPFGGALDLDELAFSGEDDVHVGVGDRIFQVVEVQPWLALDDTDADGGQRAGERVVLELTAFAEEFHRVHEGHVGAGDRGGACATVGLENITVQGDGVFTHRLEVDDGAQGTADESGDLVSASTDLAAHRLAGTTGVGRTRKHRVFGGDPSLTGPPPPARDTVLDAGRTQHAGVAELDEG